MKTIALIDTVWAGHHATYLNLFARTLLELGCKVMAFCPEPHELNEWVALNCPSLAARLHTFSLDEPEPSRLPISRLRLSFNALARWRSAAAAIQDASQKLDTSPDLVFFAYVDLFSWPYLTHHAVDKIFPYNWSGLYFHPLHLRLRLQFLHVRRGIFNPDAVFKSARCRAVAVLDEGIAQKLQTRIGNKPVVIFPDVADESPPDSDYPVVQQIREKAGGRKIIGIVGSLEKRKGILTLLEAAQQSVGENWLFVFVGVLAESTFLPEELARVRSILREQPSNCFFHFDRIPEESQFNGIVNLCDVLFAAYNNFPHSSNILTKGALFKKPAIVSQGYCIGERVEKFSLGLSIQEGDVQGCIDGLRCLCDRSENNVLKIKANFEGYYDLHSPDKLRLAFESILDTLND